MRLLTAATLLTFVATSLAAFEWPPHVLPAKDFKAFPVGNADACEIQLIFSRHFVDHSIQYDFFGKEGEKSFKLVPTAAYAGSSPPLAVVSQKDQRGAYQLLDRSYHSSLGDGQFNLSPFQLNRCKDGHKFNSFYVTATRTNPSQTMSFPAFTLSKTALTPKAVSNLTVVKIRDDQYKALWLLEERDMEDVEGVFVIYGSRSAEKLGNQLFAGAGVKSVSFSLDTNLDLKDAKVAVSLYSKEGAVTPVQLAPEVALPK